MVVILYKGRGHIECLVGEGDKQRFIATANLEDFTFFKVGESRIFHSLEGKDSIFGWQAQWNYFSKILYFLWVINCIEASIKQLKYFYLTKYWIDLMRTDVLILPFWTLHFN